jgi:hypothetical protein
MMYLARAPLERKARVFSCISKDQCCSEMGVSTAGHTTISERIDAAFEVVCRVRDMCHGVILLLGHVLINPLVLMQKGMSAFRSKADIGGTHPRVR